jgi:hypothetical protein
MVLLWCGESLSLGMYMNDTTDNNRIHERSAREKISTDQVAHVLNDEVSRKYIQSLKRYVTSISIRLV